MLQAAEGADVARLRPETLTALALPVDHDRVLILDLAPQRAERLLLVVAGRTTPPEAVRASLRALAAQVALAVERTALTEEVHRRRGEARFGSLVRHASDLITVIGPDGRISYQSPSIERLLGYDADDMVGRRFDELIDRSDRDRVRQKLDDAAVLGREEPEVLQFSLVHRDGAQHQFEVNCTNLLADEHVGGIVLNCRDISERKAFEEQLTHQAFHDPVTGLANRALFAERVRHAIARTRREHQSVAVVFLDLDDFKTINDSLGHAAGDEVLVEVAKRLATSIRATDTAARFGGDEFAPPSRGHRGSAGGGRHGGSRARGASAAARRCPQGALPALQHRHLRRLQGTPAGAEELIRDADAAMYRAKRDGKGSYRLFEPEMHQGVLARLELRTDLQRAIATEQLELYYQPVVRIHDGEHLGGRGAAPLAASGAGHDPAGPVHPARRGDGPDRPDRAMGAPGGVPARTSHAQHRACRRDLTMAINLSVKQLQHSDVIADVRDAVEEAGIEPSALTLEITETVLMADTELAVTRLQELKALGVNLALDDFGTGYSSLSYLSRFPVDILKMDRSFLREGATPEMSGLASAVLALGSTLNLDVVAEGIEQPEQWASLQQLGCEFGQGFYFARPMNAEAALEHLTAAMLADAPQP